jgi:F-type H+-transporting ATPase subunit b
MTFFVLAADTAGKAAAPAFPPFDPTHFASQLFWLAILFGALYLVLARVILPKLGSVLEHREATIATNLDEAARLNDEAESGHKAVEDAIADARTKARATATAARAKMDAEIREETAKVEADIEADLTAAEERITALRAEAMKNVQSIAVTTAAAMIAKFDATVVDDEVSAAVSDTLAGEQS